MSNSGALRNIKSFKRKMNPIPSAPRFSSRYSRADIDWSPIWFADVGRWSVQLRSERCGRVTIEMPRRLSVSCPRKIQCLEMLRFSRSSFTAHAEGTGTNRGSLTSWFPTFTFESTCVGWNCSPNFHRLLPTCYRGKVLRGEIPRSGSVARQKAHETRHHRFQRRTPSRRARGSGPDCARTGEHFRCNESSNFAIREKYPVATP